MVIHIYSCILMDYVPLPISKLNILANEEPNTIPEVDIITKRKKSTSAKFVAMENGKYLCPTFDSVEGVLRHMGVGSYNIQKLHMVGDSELITQIHKQFSI